MRGWFGPSVLDAAGAREGLATSHLESIADAEAMIASGRRVIDLRERNEWDAGHIPGAEHHPLGTLQETLAEMDRDEPVALHCQGGTRSAIGASVLESMGFTNVVDLKEGFGAWHPSQPAKVEA